MSATIRRPHIDKSELDVEEQVLPDVLSDERDLEDFLMEPGTIEKICVHEGAHLYYARMIHPSAKLIPPSIIRVSLGVYVPSKSAIDTHGINKTCDKARLLTFTKGLVSGGVIEIKHELEKGDKTIDEILDGLGDIGDRKDFKVLCQQIRDASPGLEFDDDGIRRAAERSVLADIFNPDIQVKIERVTQGVRTALLASIYPDDAS